MKLTKCSNGHFYDGDAYSSCPHCANNMEPVNHTVSYYTPPAEAAGREDNPTVKRTEAGALPPKQDDDPKTISIYTSAKAATQKKASVVGWLVCTEGSFYGQDFALRSGNNFIGRATDMDVCLEGENTVSRNRHATITHEPRQNVFTARPGESRELFYVNGDVVLSPVQLKKNDVLQIGKVRLMLIPCCDANFQWEKAEDRTED